MRYENISDYELAQYLRKHNALDSFRHNGNMVEWYSKDTGRAVAVVEFDNSKSIKLSVTLFCVEPETVINDTLKQSAENIAKDICDMNAYSTIALALIEGDAENINEYLQLCFDNYKQYSPFEFIAKDLNSYGEFGSMQAWEEFEEIVLGIFEEYAESTTTRNNVKRAIRERIEEIEDSIRDNSYESFEECLDDTSEEIRIGNLTFMPSVVLKQCDPIAYTESYNEYVNHLIEDSEEIEELESIIENI